MYLLNFALFLHRRSPLWSHLFLMTALAAVGVEAGMARAAGDRKSATPLKVFNLCTEYKENPLGIDSPHPRLSWQI